VGAPTTKPRDEPVMNHICVTSFSKTLLRY
jgi:hypothetical protein